MSFLQCTKMFTFDLFTNENNAEYNLKWPHHGPDHPC